MNHHIRKITCIGHSYNYFAAHIPFYFMNQRQITCSIYELDEFVKFFNPPNNSSKDDEIYLFISHSGDSLQIRQGLEKLKQKKINSNYIWGITTHQNSFLAKKGHYILPTHAGTETVIGTKSYVSAILVLFFLSRVFLYQEVIPHNIEQEIRQLIFEMKFYTQDWEYHVKSLTEFLGLDYDFLYFISKGDRKSTRLNSSHYS